MDHKCDTKMLPQVLGYDIFRFTLESHMVECSMESFMHVVKNTEVNLSVIVYKLFHEDFSPVIGTNLR